MDSQEQREQKAEFIAARYKLRYKNGQWLVPSQSDNHSYKICLGKTRSTCTCEDWNLHAHDCKHILAARIAAMREGIEVIENTEPPKRKTYSQNWSVYNKAQIQEKRRFQELLSDLVQHIDELPPKKGRPRTPIADVLFACAFKVYSTLSSRRFGTDLEEAYEKEYMTTNMHPNKISVHLESPELTPILKELIVRSSMPLRGLDECVAPDSSGFSTCRHERWFDEKHGRQRSRNAWVKAHILCGTKTHIITSANVLEKNSSDSPQFAPLLKETAENMRICEVVADKAYISNDNLELVERLGGVSFIPFKSNHTPGRKNSIWEKMYFYYNHRREDFLKYYHKRSNVESVFSMVKRKFMDNVRSLNDDSMRNEVLCKFLCHNICVVIASQVELGIEAEFRLSKERREDSERELQRLREMDARTCEMYV